MYVWNISIIYNIFYLSIWFFALIDIILIVKKSVLNETNKSEKPFEIIQCRQKIVFVTWPIEEIMLLCGLSKAPQMIFNIFILSRRLHFIRVQYEREGERERERDVMIFSMSFLNRKSYTTYFQMDYPTLISIISVVYLI